MTALFAAWQLAASKPDDFQVTWFGRGQPLRLASKPLFGLDANSFVLLQAVAIGLALGIWLLLIGAMLAWTRPADVHPQPTAADFPDDLPPAVVSLLANRWRLNEDAAESTLIDLAARHWIELRQPGNDPTQTTVHMLPAPGPRPGQPALTTYDQQVLEHVRTEAVHDVVPVTALTFRDADQANRWNQRLHASVINDARARGLTRRRFSPLLVSLLSALAVLPSGLLALAIFYDSHAGALSSIAGLALFAGLTGLAGRPLGERDTPLGREVAGRWLGLRTFLRNDGAFAELPPAAVTVWDRYLSYGDALGVTRVCSALIDLGMGDRKRVWSSFGGGWHRVRVHYPRVWVRYGATAPSLLLRGLAGLVIGGFLVHVFSDLPSGFPDSGNDLLGEVPLAIGVLLIVRALYRLVRTAADLLAPRSLTGEVLWVELWKTKQQKENRPALPVVHYFAVDDGSDDQTTAWAIPSDWSGRAQPGDLVTVVVRPWSRRITALTLDSSRAARLAEVAGVPVSAVEAARAASVGSVTAGDDAATQAVPTAAVPIVAVPAEAAPPLLTADEVGAVLGRSVVTDAGAGRITLGPFEMIAFSQPPSSKPVVMLAVARGRAVGLVMRTARSGTELPGVGDEAWLGKDWVVGRRGETMVRINLETGSTVAAHLLPALLTTALSRLP